MAEVLHAFLAPNYTLPGLFLLVVIGVWHIHLAYRLLARPYWVILERFWRNI